MQCIPLLCGIVLPMDLKDMIGFINFCVSLHCWLHLMIREKKYRKENVRNSNVDFHYISSAGQDIASIYIVCSRQEHILFFLFSHIHPFLKRYQQYHSKMTSGDIMTHGYGNRQETLFLQYLSQFKLAKGVGGGC